MTGAAEGDRYGYQIWSGDKWKCPSCGIEIVSGWGRVPEAEHYNKEAYAASRDRAGKSLLQVGD